MAVTKPDRSGIVSLRAGTNSELKGRISNENGFALQRTSGRGSVQAQSIV